MGITEIPTRAFVDVSTRAKFNIHLQNNDITTVAAEAFDGIDVKGNV